MKAEKQQKEPQKAETVQPKREGAKLSFVDNRPQAASQTKLIQSIQKKENIIQRQIFIRGLQVGSINNDFNYLNRTVRDEENDILFVRHYAGLLSSLTRYNEGQKAYYSPVGYIVDIVDQNKVFANFSTDGSTGDLNKNHLMYQFGFSEITNDALNSFIDSNINNPEKIADVKKGQLVLLIRQYMAADNDTKNSLVKQMLELYYTIPGVVNNPLGPGLDVEGLNIAEAKYKTQSPDSLEYTESKVGITPDDLIGAFYNDNQDTRAGWVKNVGTHRGNAEGIKTKYSLSDLYKIDAEGKLVKVT